eukprot:4077871-Pleurochrysis_carterae.AAC.1
MEEGEEKKGRRRGTEREENRLRGTVEGEKKKEGRRGGEEREKERDRLRGTVEGEKKREERRGKANERDREKAGGGEEESSYGAAAHAPQVRATQSEGRAFARTTKST